jgi:hypothetical protein
MAMANNVIIIIMAMYVCTCGNNMYVCIMYVCMYVSAYVCMYVCMYVLMYVCMYVHVYVCNVWYMGNNTCVNNVCGNNNVMYVCMYVITNVCNVCMY